MALANQGNGSRAGMSAEGDHTAEIDYFSWLSDEVIMHIFKYVRKSTLVRCAFVCHRWRRLVYDEDLWRNGSLKLESKEEISFLQLSRLLQLGLTDFFLQGGKIRDPISWDNVFPANFKSKLRYLRLHGSDVSAECIACILKHTEELDRLHFFRSKLNAECFENIGHNVIVRRLFLYECSFVVDIPQLAAILRDRVRLESLFMSTCCLTEETGVLKMIYDVPNFVKLFVDGVA